MNDPLDSGEVSIPRPVVEQIDRVCDRFEALWKEGGKPRIKDYLGLDSSIEDTGLRRRLLVELIMIDLEYRWKCRAGKASHSEASARAFPTRLKLADYMTRYPELGALEDLPDGLIGEEYRARQLWGDRPSHEDYLAQFGPNRPELRDVLAKIDKELAGKQSPEQTGSAAAPISEAQSKAASRGSQQTDALDAKSGSPPTPKRKEASTSSEFGNYRVLRSLAKGGMGEVSIAEDKLLKRKVVLKQILEEFAENPKSRRRFVTEARITGQLEHPGIVPVYGLGVDRHGQPFYTMRRVRGDTLEKTIASYHLKPTLAGLRELLRRFIAVCQTVAYTHARGVIHRDLKPSNVMLGNYGETLLLDWGLAKPVVGRISSESTVGDVAHQYQAEFPKLTKLGAKVGTAPYMSPEQAEAGAEEVGPPADIYGLGGILYQLLTGTAPYTGKSSDEILEKVRSAPPEKPSEVGPDVPPPLEAICLKAMARRAEERYLDAAALAADVQNWLDDEPVATYPDPWLTQAWRWARHHRTTTISGLVFLFTAIVAIAVGTVVVEKTRARAAVLLERERAQKEAVQRQVDEANALADEKEREAQRLEKERDEEQEKAVTAMEKATTWEVAAKVAQGQIEQLEADARTSEDQLEQARAERRTAETRAAEAEALASVAGHKADKLHQESAKLRQEAQELRELAAELSELASDQELDVEPPQPEPSPLVDFTEGNEDRFDVVASDTAFSLLTSDWSRQRTGKGSLRVDTLTDDRVCVVYPSTRSANWDLSSQKYINLALFGRQRSNYGLKDLWLRIGRGSSYFEYQPGPQLVANARERWLQTSIPLSGGTDWTRSDTNQLDLSHVDWIEVHASTSAAGLTFWLDDLGFTTKPVLSWIPGPIPAPAKLPGISRWQVDTVAPRLQVETIAWSPDGKLIACGTQSGKVRIYDASTLRLVRLLVGHTGIVRSVAWSPDGRRLASASQDKTLPLWEADGTRGPVLESPWGIFCCVAWSPDGSQLASGDLGTVRLWKSDGTPGPVLAEHIGPIRSVAWSRDGRLASGGADGAVRLWEADGSPGPVLEGHTATVSSVAWSRDGRLASASEDGTVRMWQADGTPGPVLEGHTGGAKSVAWSPDGRWLVSGGLGSPAPVRLWEANGKPGPVFEKFLEGLGGHVLSVAWSPDGQRLVSAGAWGIRVLEAEGALGPALHRQLANVWSVAWSPDGGQLVSAGWDGTLRLWETDGTPGPILQQLKGLIFSVAWSPDGKQLASGHRFNVRVWEPNGTPGPILKASAGDVYSVAWSPDSQWLVAGSRDRSVRLLKADGTQGLVLEGHTSDVNSVAWNPDGQQLASASWDGTVRLWQANGTRGPVLEGHTERVRSVAWSPDGRWLASGGDHTVRLWKPDGTPGSVLRHAHPVFSVAWSPDSRRVAAGHVHTVRLWDTDGTRRSVLEGAAGTGYSLAWSPNGRWLVGGNLANTILLWDIDTGEPQWVVLLLNDGKSVTFSPAGEILHGDPKVIEKELVYLVEKLDGAMELLKPSEFRKRTAALAKSK